MNEIFNNDCTLHDKLMQIQVLDNRRKMLDTSNQIDLKIGTKDGSAYIFCGSDIDKALDKMKDFLNRKVVEVYDSIDILKPFHTGINILIEGTEHGRHWFEGDHKKYQKSGDASEYGSVKEKRKLVGCAIRNANLPNDFTMNWATDNDNMKQALKKQKTDLKRALEAAYELGYDFSCSKDKILNAEGPNDIGHIMHTLAVDDYI